MKIELLLLKQLILLISNKVTNVYLYGSAIGVPEIRMLNRYLISIVLSQLTYDF